MASAPREHAKIMCAEKVVNETSILNLNNDCLRTICECMDLLNLCAFADVCHRFQDAARAHFGSAKCTIFRDVNMIKWDESMKRVQFSFLRNFGPSINSLRVSSSGRNDKFLFDSIVRNCSGTLNALGMRRFNIDRETAQKLLSFILGLKELRMADCTVKDYRGFIQHFPKLESFSVDSLSFVQFKEFLMKNQQLKHINNLIYDNRCFMEIVRCLPQIESLNTHAFRGPKFVKQITSLKKIKNLCIYDWNGCGEPTIIKAICGNLGELTQLFYRGTGHHDWCQEDFLDIIRGAEKLQKLFYRNKKSDLFIDTEFFEELVNIVVARSEKERLRIILEDCFGLTIKLSNKIKKKYEHVLTIDVRDRDDYNFSNFDSDSDGGADDESDPNQRTHSESDSEYDF